LYYYEGVLSEGLLPDIRAKCRQYRWTLQQDGTPSRTANNTLVQQQGEHTEHILCESVVANVDILKQSKYLVFCQFPKAAVTLSVVVCSY